MPVYVLLSTLTSEGRKTIKQKLERIKGVNKEIEAYYASFLGIRLKKNNSDKQYAATQIDDFLELIKKKHL